MKEITAKQYNKWAEGQDRDTMKYDQVSRKSFYSFFKFETNGKKLLDIASGTGHDLQLFAAERSGLELCGWQLPQRRGASAFRPALLER